MRNFYSIIKCLAVGITLALSGNLMFAADFEVDGIYYNILTENTCAVTFAGDTYNSVADEYEGDVTIPATVSNDGIEYNITTIGSRAFTNCKNLVSISMPNSITTIERAAFSGCSSLLELTIPENVTLIPNSMCVSCASLENIVIPDGVETIESSAFFNAGLTSITLPSTITKINTDAFKGVQLTSIKILAKTPPTITSSSFTSETQGKAVLEVPEESLSKYKITDFWRNFVNIKKLDIATSIDSTIAEETAEVEYYNILGVKVNNPTKGLYIKKCGNKAYKVIL